MPGITLDAGGLIALDRSDRRVVVLLARAAETNSRVTIPASALAQAIRRPERQARLARLIRQPSSDVVQLDRVDAVNVGRLLAASGTSDVVDAHVVVCARRTAQRVVTSDPDDLRLLDPRRRVDRGLTSRSSRVPGGPPRRLLPLAAASLGGTLVRRPGSGPVSARSARRMSWAFSGRPPGARTQHLGIQSPLLYPVI